MEKIVKKGEEKRNKRGSGKEEREWEERKEKAF